MASLGRRRNPRPSPDPCARGTKGGKAKALRAYTGFGGSAGFGGSGAGAGASFGAGAGVFGGSTGFGRPL
jgi:hypothetical protein